MNLRFMKWIPFTLSITCAMVQGHCESDLNSRVSRLETDMKKVRGQTAYDNFGAKTALACPQIDGFGFFITGEFLWWKLYEFDSDFVFSQKPSSTLFKGNVHGMNFHWDPGFRIGLGYVFDYDGWDLFANFTDYETRADKRKKAHEGGALFPLWGEFITSPPLEEMHAKWHVHFYELDLLLGRNYFVSKYLSLHPFCGLTFAWIRQNRKARMQSDVAKYAIHEKNNFRGVGTRIGVDTQFFLGRHFSLYAGASGALLWGNFSVREKETVTPATTTGFHDNTVHVHRMIPNVDVDLGIAYETNFNAHRNHLCIKVGYENQYWWNQNQIVPFITPPNAASHALLQDLAMHGLTLDVRVDF